MSKASEDLKKIMQQMASEAPAASESQAGKPEAAPSGRGGGGSTQAAWLTWGAGLCAALGLAGLLLQNAVVAGFGGAGSLLGILGLGLLRGREGGGLASNAGSDIAVEVIKRKSLELERDRVRGELERTHRAMQGLNDKLVASEEELSRVKTEKTDAIVKKDAELRDKLEEEKLRLRGEVETEKKSLLEREKHELDALHQESLEREKLLEESLNREIAQLKSELAGRDKKLADLNAEIFKLRDQIERQAEAAPNEIAERMAQQNKVFDEERKAFARRTEEQAQAAQRKSDELEANYARNRAELEKKLDELGARAVKLQEALDQKVAAGSEEAARHIEEVRRSYEAQRDALQKKLLEQGEQHQKKLAEQENSFSARKGELLAACDALVKEIEAREDDLNKRETGARQLSGA